MAEIPRGMPLGGWSSQMRDELGRLPETAANIREASENLKRVSAELVDVSALLAQVVRLMESTGMVEGLSRAERLSNDLDAVRKFVTPPTSVDAVKDRVAQVEHLVAGLNDRVLRGIGLARTDPQPPAPPRR